MLSRFLRHVPTRLAAPARCFSTTGDSSFKPNRSIYLSESTNPLFNLSLEDWLFRHAPPDEPLLLIYRDEPCVVVGRNQNPWKEVNTPALRRTGIPFVRRRSGGGTVYHDLGNTNFSIHLPRTSFDRHATAQVVLRAVQALGIDAHVNDRNDICVGKDKVSGSAYKIVNKRAYHHGTMLISTQLETLGDLLRTKKETMVTKGVASVRSPVCNLQLWGPNVTHDAFANSVIEAFRSEYSIDEKVVVVQEDDDTRNIEHIRNGMAELPSWKWAYGQTPEFTYTLQNLFEWGDVTANIRSKHGIILSCSFDINGRNSSVGKDLSNLSRLLEGKRYGFVEDAAVGMDSLNEEDPSKAVWQWLKTEMEG